MSRGPKMRTWPILRNISIGLGSYAMIPMTLQGHLAHKTPPPLGPYIRTMPRVLGGS